MKEPMVSVSALLSAQQLHDKEREGLKWAVQAWSDTKDTAANGIMQIVDKVKAGNQVHYYTDGAWSMYQLLIALIELTGKCDIYLSTYAMSETSARCIANLKDTGLMNRLYCLIDNRSDTRSAGSMQLLRQVAYKCSLAACHAKVTILEGAKASVLVLGSANYTENNRVECGIVTSDHTAAAFHKEWITRKIQEHDR